VTRHLIADTHFGDGDVLEYTGRPFDSVAEMNDALRSGWNDAVDEDETVVFVGDFAVPSEPTTVRRWHGQVEGDVVFVAGDHDDGARRSHAIETSAAHRFEAGGYEFSCVHRPEAAPPDHDGWVVHGHHHDIRPGKFPFLDPDARRINVAAELLGYEPIPVPELLAYVDDGRRLRRRPE
jgi:calcineurin-like phosphoesterase family protein